MIPFIIICTSGLSLIWLLTPSRAPKRESEPITLEVPDRVETDFHEPNHPAIAHK